jgi:hypothetical protein
VGAIDSRRSLLGHCADGPGVGVGAGRRSTQFQERPRKLDRSRYRSPRETRKIAQLPPRGSVDTVNADETLLAGTYIEGDRPQSSGGDKPYFRRDRRNSLKSSMLRPFPQYSNITDLWGDVGNSNYNSLQIYLNKRLSAGLTFNFNYVYAKAFDDTASNMVSAQSFTLGSAYNWKNQKAMTQLPGHTVNLLAVYQLPFGRNRTYLNSDGFVSKIAGVFLDKNTFVSPAAYAYGNTPRTNVYGIQNPGTHDEDISLKREFPIRENLKVAIQADAFNVFNLVTFAAPSTSVTSSNFGKISAQSNSPRILQLGARVSF